MGYYSSIIIGVRKDELISEEVEVTTSKKYNENTGEPYEIKEKRYFLSFLGKEILENDIEKLLAENNIEEIEYNDEKYIGECFSVASEWKGSRVFSFKDINKCFDNVQNFLVKIGYRYKPYLIHTIEANC